ncbi:MAG TPA: helix-turn-helix domain-containing protein [Herpetosiphonaceae bacterium]
MDDQTRAYRSAARAEQKAQTRAKILDGLIAVMNEGLAEITIPAVARAAGVSVPTVYRYFASKEALLEALPGHLGAALGVAPAGPPQTVGDLAELVREIYGQLEGKDDLVRAALMSDLASRSRQVTVPRRLAVIEHVLAPEVGHRPAAERELLRDTLFILSTSAVVNAYKDYLGLSWAAAAERAAWAMLLLARAVAEQQGGADDPDEER